MREVRPDDALLILTTVTGEELARDVARLLVGERLAACVNLLAVQSVYRWKGKVEQADERLLVIKSSKERWPRLRARIAELQDYEVPEIVSLSPSDVESTYLAWLIESCRPTPEG
ncbi:MAG: divalent-cation tolerance protein CutA [Candidatus Binatia bacterium]